MTKGSDFSKNYLRSFLFYRKESDIMEEKIREELYSKLESEFDSYKKELETLTSKEIIDKSYETTMKEELMCLFYPESQRYDLDEIKALKNEKNSFFRQLKHVYIFDTNLIQYPQYTLFFYHHKH